MAFLRDPWLPPLLPLTLLLYPQMAEAELVELEVELELEEVEVEVGEQQKGGTLQG